MSKDSSSNSSCSIGGIPTVLTIIFVIAKILGYIDWSWWVVFLPLIISVSLMILTLVFIFVLYVLSQILED